jgi:hypothetical protein
VSETTAGEFASEVLRAFSSNEDACAEFLLAHASPRFASSVGDTAHLKHLFKNPAWAPLLSATSREIVSLDCVGDAARATVRAVQDAGGPPADYLLSVKRSEAGVWAITGLVRAELTAM